MSSASMSALMDEAIKMCKAEEAKLTESIRLCRDILRSMKTPVKDKSGAETSPGADFGDEITLKERQEIDLLEQALKKAVKVRSSCTVSTEPNTDGHEKQRSKELPNHESKAQNSDAIKDVNSRKPQKSSATSRVYGSHHQHGRKVLKSAVSRKAVRTQHELKKGATAAEKHLTMKPDMVQILAVDAERKSCQKDNSSDRKKVGLGQQYTEDCVSVSENKLRSQMSPSKVQWVQSPLLPVWSAQRMKMTRLWNTILTEHCKPVPERNHFRERLMGTFPKNWPCGQTAAWRTELDALTQLGLDLTHCYHAEVQRQRSFKTHVLGKAPETSFERDYESLLMLDGLERMMAKVVRSADNLKKECEKKVKWWYEDLHPVRMRGGLWSDPEQPCLPPLLSYGSHAEFVELTTLSLQIEQLRLEIRLHQAMSETLKPHLTSRLSSSGSPSATMLRGLYSLLGEGGTKFPALVVDSVVDQTSTKR